MGAANDDDGTQDIPVTTSSVLDLGVKPCETDVSADSATTPAGHVPPAESPAELSNVILTKCDTLEATAKAAWDAYSKELGGKAFNGDPLPTWEALVADSSKSAIARGWRAAANAAVSAFFASTTKEQ